jgi:rhodanese-related sulfurtransferase
VSDVFVPEVDVQEAAQRQAAGAALIDVREPDEFDDVRAVGAVLLPLGELPDRAAEVPAGGPVLVICRSGARSARAVQYLVAQGVDATNVAGGTIAWLDAGLPTASGPSSAA